MRSRQSGLTLVEVLVALAVLASAVGAILVLIAGQSRGTAALTENALARIVAENAMVAVVTEQTDNRSPSGEEDVGGRRFAWTARVSASPIQGTQLVEIEVRLADTEQVIATLGTLTEDPR